jgi:hypothetical protein
MHQSVLGAASKLYVQGDCCARLADELAGWCAAMYLQLRAELIGLFGCSINYLVV